MADMDMDIEMDIDVGIIDDMAVQEIDLLPDEPMQQTNDAAPNDPSGPDAQEPVPNKVHIRGLDNLTTKDIKDFANDYYSEGRVERVEWIDDSSANIIYETAEAARKALVAFAEIEIADVAQLPILQAIPAKALSKHPDTRLHIRLAVVGDRKQAGARDRSRFYLMNPEHDPAERRKREKGRRGGNRYRDRDDGGYRSQRYDDREQRRRQDDDAAGGFDASLYDDDDAALAVRASRKHSRRESTSSGSDYRGRGIRRVRFSGTAGKELFPDRNADGRLLRDRSASPLRDGAAERNREKARLIKNRLLGSDSEPRELFPHKTGVTHRRSGAFDAADETADLFATKINVPLVDGSSDRRGKRGASLADRITPRGGEAPDGFNIKGTANVASGPGFSIKGAANVRELFPASKNSGKELFSEPLEGRGGRRQKAEDLFR
ncbi:hypothetical protein PVAG01_09629 [Phlyctema vagabunda]|uniref:RRM domain-containing protein n=1 Tax=Phlyctema vagabunda TaxID=108571 RepID=A0ABR4P8B0_9HELO